MLNYEQVLNHLSIGVAVINRSLEVQYWNRWMEEHSLIPAEQILDCPIDDIFSPGMRREFIKKARQVLRTGSPAFFTNKVHQHVFPFHTVRSYMSNELSRMEQTVILSPLLDKEGETTRILISVFDISDWVFFQNELKESRRELEKLTLIDDLTQIPNRRAIMEQLNRQLSIHLRKKRPLALIVLDIDHFKKVNDTHGHQCGDVVLRKLAWILVDALRGYDIVGRYGGEEFVIILPESNRNQAVLVAERLRAMVEETPIAYQKQQIDITVSLGVAIKGEQEKVGQDKLFKVADRCLYMAKEHGRNKVVVQD